MSDLFFPLKEPATAAEPTSAACSPPTAGSSPPTGSSTTAEQCPDQWNCWGSHCRWRGHWRRSAAQPGLRAESGASKQEAPDRAFGCKLRRACYAIGLSALQFSPELPKQRSGVLSVPGYPRLLVISAEYPVPPVSPGPPVLTHCPLGLGEHRAGGRVVSAIQRTPR